MSRSGAPRASRTPSSGIIPARQGRSRDTENRLLSAARDVIVRSGVPNATVAEICRVAGVAVGTFYGRFRDKDALLAAFFADYYRRAAVDLDAAFPLDAWRGRPVAEIVAAWVEHRVEGFRERRALTRAILTYTRTHGDPAFRAAAAEFSALVIDRFASLLTGSSDGIGHPAPRRAAVIVVSAVEALLKEMALYGEVRSRALAIADDELIPELTRLARGYLELPTAGGSS